MSTQDAMSGQIQGIVIMKKFTEFKKKQIVNRYLKGEKVAQIAKATKVSRSTVYFVNKAV